MFETANVRIHADEGALALAAAARWDELARSAIAAHGEFHVALTGGSTPRTLYQLLATPDWQQRIDWRHSQVYFGDERCVPPEHPDSNFRMAHEILLSKCPLPTEQVHRIEGEREPAAAARAYAGELRQYLGRAQEQSPPRLDLLLLGLGADGHIASLFPGSPLLDETEEWVGAAYTERLKAWRVSLTYPILNRARHTLFLVAGPAKAAVIQSVLGGGDHWRSAPLPVERLNPQGSVEWYIDRAAAAGLGPYRSQAS